MLSLIKSSEAQTRLEEVLNALSHTIGIFLAIAALVILVVKASLHGTATMVVGGAIYGVSLILMYSASSLYHIVQSPRAKKCLKVFDHCSIYILIAGSYTPFVLVSLHGPWGWSLFGVIWSLAVMGTVFKLFFTGRFDKLSVAVYVLMGWMVVVAVKPMIQHVPLGGLIWLLLGGLSYTLGVFFYFKDDRYQFSHFIWHLFVLLGSICQFFAILCYVVR